MRRNQAKGDQKGDKERQEREAEERRAADQEELRRKVIEEQMAKDPIIRYVEELKVEKQEVEDPLDHPLVWGSPEEWSNIPRLVAKYCIHTQAHLHGVVLYLKARSGEETTMSLRAFIERENDSQNTRFSKFKKHSTERIDKLF